MKFIFTYLFIIILFSIKAQEVDLQTAEKIAINFAKENCSNKQISNSLSGYKQFKTDDITDFYIINFSDNNGFVIVSAQKNIQPILGYSFESSFNFNQIPASLNYLLENYKTQINYAVKNNMSSDINIAKLWGKYTNNTSYKNGTKQSNIPFIKTNWGQGCYYNALCPVDANTGTGYCGFAPTGCGATAMSQILKYYNFPLHGVGSNSYFCISYLSTLSANFGSSTYQWSLMPNVVNSTNSTVATLMYNLGVAFNMQYSTNGSGSLHADILDAMKNNFKFSTNTTWLLKSNYSVDSVWEQLIRNEIDSLRPVFYYGTETGGTIFDGHYFIFDAYQNNNYFHINWGFDGVDNGYFYVTNLTACGWDFTQDQRFLKGLIPSGSFCTSKTFTDLLGSFGDGSDTSNYFDDADCSYNIDIANGNIIVIDFTSFSLSNGDTLYIYNGQNVNGSLIGKYTGTSLPASIYSQNNHVYLNFRTNDNTTSSGWELNYHNIDLSIDNTNETEKISIFPNPCSGFINIKMNDINKKDIIVNIYDISGRKLISESIKAQNISENTSINISELPMGLYNIVVKSEDINISKKISIVR